MEKVPHKREREESHTIGAPNKKGNWSTSQQAKKQWKAKGKCTALARPQDLPTDDFPVSFDWEKEDKVIKTPVLPQQRALICWAFAVSGATEALYNIHNRDSMKELSIQELVNCVETPSVDKVFGGPVTTLKKGFRFVRKQGLSTATDCPYEYGIKKDCMPKKNPHNAVHISSFILREADEIKESDLLETVCRHPIAAVFKIDAKFGALEAKDVYMGAKAGSKVADHAVLIVGFGTDRESINYWRFKNSHGDNWCDRGYGKIARQSSAPNGRSLLRSIGYPVLF